MAEDCCRQALLDFVYQVTLSGKMREMRVLMMLSWRPLSVTACALLPLALSGCATSSYMGIALTSGSADPELKQLAQLARLGDKRAQLQLGIAFEEGRGMPVDIGRARRLYQQAASGSGGTVWVYVPSTVKGQHGRVTPVASGPKVSGLAQAKARLEALEADK